jgi:hypothetical protein
MAGLALKVTLRGAKGAFRPLIKRVQNPAAGRAREPLAQAMRDSAVRDFRDQGHHGPSGFTRWPETHAFGDCPPAAQILGGTQGGLAQAWRTAKSVPSKNSVAIIATHPGIRAHAFGARIAVTEKMRGFLGAVCDVHLKASTSTLVIPARRFADKNPELARDVEKIAEEALLA